MTDEQFEVLREELVRTRKAVSSINGLLVFWFIVTLIAGFFSFINALAGG